MRTNCRDHRELLIIKIVDFRDDPPENEPAFDVEVYRKGKFIEDSNSEGVFSTRDNTENAALKLAKEYAHRQISNFELKEAKK